MRALRIAIPSHEVLTLFKQLTKDLWERQRVIHSENVTLTKIRDTLLPRLFSGKLRVDEISETVEAVAI
jgi:type I restriction enzyme S subunit